MKFKYSFRSDTLKRLEVMVEPTPDRYIAPGQALVIEEDEGPSWEPLSVVAYDGGIQIWPFTLRQVISVDGKPGVTNWDAPPKG